MPSGNKPSRSILLSAITISTSLTYDVYDSESEQEREFKECPADKSREIYLQSQIYADCLRVHDLTFFFPLENKPVDYLISVIK